MVERDIKIYIEKFKLFFFKQLYNLYVQCTFCIMDWLVNFNSELKSIFKKLLKLLKLNPKLSDLILSRRKVEL